MAPDPALVDPGPTSVRPFLVERIREAGVDPRSIRHLALTHIHLDHAGSAGAWVAENPDVTVHLHEDAGLHLVHPRRLVASTRRTFGEAHDRLWGEVIPVPAHAIRGIRPGEKGRVPGLRPLHTPGHMEQHLAWLHEESGFLAAGDAMGIVLAAEAPVHPPTPPPTLDLAAWHRTLHEIAGVGPESFGAAHFGVYPEPAHRARELGEALTVLAHRASRSVAAGTVDGDAEAFQEETVATLAPFRPEGEVERYFATFSAANDYRGMARYVEQNPEWREPS